MMMKAAPVAPFVVAQAELGFELLVVALDEPAALAVATSVLNEVFAGSVDSQ